MFTMANFVRKNQTVQTTAAFGFASAVFAAAGRYNGSLSVYDARTYKQVREPMTVFDAHQPARGNDAKEAASR